MNIIIWMITGVLIGWAASLLGHAPARQPPFLDIAVGTCGAMLGGWFFSPLLGLATIGQQSFSVASWILSLLAAVLFIGCFRFLFARNLR